MVAPCQWFTHSFLLALKFMSVYVHRSTLPQSRIRSTAPSERDPGRGAYHSTYRPKTAGLRAIFIAPTKLKNRFLLPFIEVHSLREGAGMGCIPFNVPPGNRKVAGDFHRPYETLNVSHFTIQRTTLPQSRFRSTAPSEREPGWGAYRSTFPPKP